MAIGDRDDPYRTFYFDVYVEGLLLGGFSEVSNIAQKQEIVEYRAGNAKTSFSAKLTGRSSFDNVTLKRGYVKDDRLWRWSENLKNGVPDRRNVTITLKDEARNAVMSWGLEGTWVVSIMGPGFNAMGNDVAIESVELAVENVTMQLEGESA